MYIYMYIHTEQEIEEELKKWKEQKTKYGKDGVGGVMTKGCMYVGYPR